MNPELTVLAWGCILALVHIFAAATVKTRQYGKSWNMGARDEELPPLNPLAGRLVRAQQNFFETFPLLIAVSLALVLSGRADELTAIGAWLWLAARVVYLPLYALGVPMVRTLVFLVSVVGILVMLWPLLT